MPRAVVEIKGQAERNLIARWAANVDTGTTVEFRSPRRSTDANAMMWSLLGQIAKQVTWHGQKLTAEDFKDLCSASLRRYHLVPGIDPGTFVPLGMRTSQMTKEEMADLIELIIAFGTGQGVKFREFEEVAA
jgi:hypothetical protein